MPKQFQVNSQASLQGFFNHCERLFSDHKVVRFFWRLGKDRSLDQNRMCFELYQRIGRSLYGDDSAHARAECKLTIGVPILREEDEKFRESYDKIIKPVAYQDKLDLMEWFPVTRLMTVKQCQRYIDTVFDRYTLKGVDFGALLDAQH
ncbi:hypothetical protein [Microbulbifer discodermiae]|uniref:hypothetical protein n=1 Tax=Microbulbifer sp. 2201CG32-9 TaxID=3232309 RepID=UPI00345BDB54